MIQLLSKGENIPYDLLLLADQTIEAIDKYIFTSDIYVLKRGYKITGLYVLQTLSSKTIEIKNIAVDTIFQGQGVGRILLTDAINRAQALGFKRIIIGTGDRAFKQISLYQKVGFEIYQIRHRFFLENYPEPIYENGIQLKHMIVLKKELD